MSREIEVLQRNADKQLDGRINTGRNRIFTAGAEIAWFNPSTTSVALFHNIIIIISQESFL